MKKLLLILCTVNTAYSLDFGINAGTLGAGFEIGYKYHDFEIDGIYNNSTINYQNVDTNFKGYELLLKYYINNNFYLVGGYINQTIDAGIDTVYSAYLPIQEQQIKGIANYSNMNKNTINSPYFGLGYKTYMTQHFILDVNAGITQSYKENTQDVLIKTDISDLQLEIPVHEGYNTVYPVFNLSIKYEF
jgi:hypothetical protein